VALSSVRSKERYFSLLGAIGDALHPGHSSAARRFLVIRFYLDVSGKASDPVMVAAGYLADEKRWRKFERAWGDILRDAQVSEFHATDFFNARGAFSGWDLKSERHRTFAERFTGAVAKHTQIGFAFGVEVGAMDEKWSELQKRINTPHNRYTPLMVCLCACLTRAARSCLAPPHQAAVIFEEGDGMGETIEYLNYLKRMGEGWPLSYVSFTTMGKSARPLQAADLLAHESWRRLKEVLKTSGRAERKSLLALLRHKDVEIQLLTKETMRGTSLRIAKWLDENPRFAARS